jgi:hypothetical protein
MDSQFNMVIPLLQPFMIYNLVKRQDFDWLEAVFRIIYQDIAIVEDYIYKKKEFYRHLGNYFVHSCLPISKSIHCSLSL